MKTKPRTKAVGPSLRDRVTEWAGRTVRNPGGQPCATCRSGPEVKETIDIVIREKIEGRSEATVPDLHRFLTETFGFRASCSALRQHLRLHTSWPMG